MMFKRFALAAALVAWGGSVFALGRPAYVATTPTPGGFVLAQAGGAAPIWVDEADWPGVIRAAGDLQADIARVTGVTPVIGHDAARPGARVVIIGTLGRSALIDRLARDGRIDVSGIRGQWESFVAADRSRSAARRLERARHRRQRQARHDLRHLRSVRADRRVALVLVGRRHAGSQGRALREARHVPAGRAEREIPRHLPQRREARPRLLGAREVRRASDAGRRPGHRRQLQSSSSTRSCSRCCCA